MRHRAEWDALPPIHDEAQRELAAVEEILASRERLTLSAAQLAPPFYVVAELGHRPADRLKRGCGIAALE